jgi:1,2-diacylglycerol 3-alpha-glucosyltransferase
MRFEYRTLFEKPFEMIPVVDQKKAVERLLDELQPAGVMATGYYHAGMRVAAIWAKRHSVPCIMTTDSTLRDKPRFRPKEFLKGVWCRRYYSALFLSGSRSTSYYTRLGFAQDKIWMGTDVVDNVFHQRQSQFVKGRESEERARLGVPDRYFLTVARLSPEKNISGLLAAFASYRNQGGGWHLVIVGAGPQEEELKKLTVDQSIPGVRFMGWQEYEDLSAYYALGSCLIMPSISETWGLVVNEAMACGLPVLVSRRCGCQLDLCRRGINGYDFDPYDTDELTKLMLRFSGGEIDLGALGRQSLKIIANYTPETWALSLKDCFLTTLENFPRGV